MTPAGSDAPAPAGPAQPHRDPKRFDEVVASVTPESLLVVIDRSLGPLVRSVYAAEDVWQETLFLAWRDRDQHVWQGPRAYRSWLVTIAQNRIRDLARTLGREKRGGGARPVLFSGLGRGAGDDGGDAAGCGLEGLLPAGSTTPSRVAQHREQATLLAEALDSLPADLADVLRLHLFEERTMEDAAATLGITTDQGWYRFRKGAALYARKLEALRTARASRSVG